MRIFSVITHIKSIVINTKRKLYLTNCDNLCFFCKFHIRNIACRLVYNNINMKRLLSFIVANMIVLSAWCQTSLFYNNGASVYMMPGSYMIVSNDSLHNYQGIIQ